MLLVFSKSDSQLSNLNKHKKIMLNQIVLKLLENDVLLIFYFSDAHCVLCHQSNKTVLVVFLLASFHFEVVILTLFWCIGHPLLTLHILTMTIVVLRCVLSNLQDSTHLSSLKVLKLLIKYSSFHTYLCFPKLMYYSLCVNC